MYTIVSAKKEMINLISANQHQANYIMNLDSYIFDGVEEEINNMLDTKEKITFQDIMEWATAYAMVDIDSYPEWDISMDQEGKVTIVYSTSNEEYSKHINQLTELKSFLEITEVAHNVIITNLEGEQY